jgi:hypothetical protein
MDAPLAFKFQARYENELRIAQPAEFRLIRAELRLVKSFCMVCDYRESAFPLPKFISEFGKCEFAV